MWLDSRNVINFTLDKFEPYFSQLWSSVTRMVLLVDPEGRRLSSLLWGANLLLSHITHLLLWFPAWTSHDMLDPIRNVLAKGLPFSRQSLGDYFKGEILWVFNDLADQVLPTLKSAFLYALPQSQFCDLGMLCRVRASKNPSFVTYFERMIYWEYTVKILDRNMKYLRSYST